MNIYFPKIERWVFPGNAIQSSLEELARDGSCGNEGICLWLGDRNNGVGKISYSVHLRGDHIEKSPFNITIQPELMREVHSKAQELNVSLIGQIHSHSIKVGVDLSWVDLKYGISVPDYLSIVAPNYGLTLGTRLIDCGVHSYDASKGYFRLSEKQIKERISEESLQIFKTLIIE